MNYRKSAIAFALGVTCFAQTMHEDDRGGLSNTVTIYTKSRTHLDSGLLANAGVTVAGNQVWQHGHNGPRILRVTLPDFAKHHRSKDLLGRTIVKDDVIEISLADSQNKSLGLLKLRREKTAGSAVTSGHAELIGADLRSCVERCPVCGQTTEKPPASCAEAVKMLTDSPAANDQDGTTWIFEFDKQVPSLAWVPKTPSNFDSIRQIIAAKLPEPVRFEFGLSNGGSLENIQMKELRVIRNGKELLKTPMPKGAKFQVCGADEKTNTPKCDPLPECNGFWDRHFNRSCRLYGGTGVLSDRESREANEHKH